MLEFFTPPPKKKKVFVELIMSIQCPVLLTPCNCRIQFHVQDMHQPQTTNKLFFLSGWKDDQWDQFVDFFFFIYREDTQKIILVVVPLRGGGTEPLSNKKKFHQNKKCTKNERNMNH